MTGPAGLEPSVALAWMRAHADGRFALDAEQVRLLQGLYGVPPPAYARTVRPAHGPGLYYYGPDGWVARTAGAAVPR